MRAGHNQYAPMAGTQALRAAIATKVEALYGTAYDPEHEITVTAGATQALFTAVTACVHPGDEVIVFEPVLTTLDVPAIELAGGKVVRMRLAAPDYRPDWNAVAAAIGPRTRMIMINTPHNPTATVWTRGDLDRLAALVRGTGIVVVADEVYEHIVFDGAAHASCAAHSELAQRSFVVSSFGKTYHITGWKVGYVLAPRELMVEFRKVHQFNVFTGEHPGAACARRLHGRRLAPPRPGRLLPGQARLLPRRAGRLPLRAAALARHLLPARALCGDLGPGRCRLLRVPHA